MTLEAALWREVCQHLELDESVQRVSAILAEHLALHTLIIRRIQSEPARLTTVAVSVAETSWPSRTKLDPWAEEQLGALFARGKPSVVQRGATSAGSLVPEGLSGTVVALPLTASDRPVGVALLAVGDSEVDASGLQRLEPAVRPIEVAFENDQRLHELARMREALEADRAALLTRLQRQDISDVVIGESAGLRGVMERVEQVARTDAPVLILGETGSGKEVIARAIHGRSRRVRGPVVRINCGAIPPELVDSELFGHERGAFTGAIAARKGWFERADGGTLFLDEIGELPPAAQVRLLRVLQDGTLERVGGADTISVDVRIVAATHRNLESMVVTGGFREDLWYRLSVFPIRLPALRERMEDLGTLGAHFAARAGKRLGGTELRLDDADMALLRGYGWPGNVRELAAVIERAAILGNGKRLELAAALGPSVRSPRGAPVEAPVADDPSGIPTLDQAMATHIRRALAACQGRVEGPFGAAKVLGINPHTLRGRMRKLELDWARFRPS